MLFLSSTEFGFSFLITKFFKIVFQQYYQCQQLNPAQAQHFVSPDLGPKCLQRLNLLTTSVDKVKKNLRKAY